MAEKIKWIAMKHKQSGKEIFGVHPDAVESHQAIGYEVFEGPEEPKVSEEPKGPEETKGPEEPKGPEAPEKKADSPKKNAGKGKGK